MKRLLSLLLAALVVSTALVGAVGMAAAQETTEEPTEEPTATPADDGHDLDQTLKVSNDTRSLYVEAENTTVDGVEVTIYGITDDGITEQVDSGTLVAEGNGTTDLYEYEVDATQFGEYRVIVNGDAERLDAGKVEQVTGGIGGGIGLDGVDVSDDDLKKGGAAVVIVGVVILFLRD